MLTGRKAVWQALESRKGRRMEHGRTLKDIIKDLRRSQEFFARCGLVTEANLIGEAISTMRRQAKEIERLRDDDGK